MKSNCIIILSLLYCASINAQVTVSGKAVNGEKKKLEYATAGLYKVSDSSRVTEVLAGSDGRFIFTAVPAGNYYLTLSKVGYLPQSKPLQVEQQPVDVGAIELNLKSTVLQTAVVTATKPFLEQKSDKLVVNVAGSITGTGSSAAEILQRVPGIMLLNDRLSVSGKNNIILQIDGRTSPYVNISQLLREMPSSNIEKIELVSNPGAQYDASGAVIINIITRKTEFKGTNANVNLTTGIAPFSSSRYNYIDQIFSRINPSFSYNHRNKRWNIFGGGSYQYRTFFNYTSFNRRTDLNDFIQQNYAPGWYNTQSLRTGVDYYHNQRNIFGIFVSMNTRNGTTQTNNNTEQYELFTGKPVNRFRTGIRERNRRFNYELNANWKHYFKTQGSTINTDITFNRYSIENNSDINTYDTLQQQLGSNLQQVKNPISFFTLKTDYTRPLNKSVKLDAGVKTSFSKVDNDLLFYEWSVLNKPRSNRFLYREQVLAGYMSIKKTFKKGDMQTGIRAEYTSLTGSTAGLKVVDRSYINFFPSLQYSHTLNKKLSLTAQFSSRITRPDYQSLNPFTYYLDSLTYRKGNPQLSPERSYSSRLILSYNNRPLLAVSYTLTDDVIFRNAPEQDGNKTFSSPQNLATFYNFTLEANYPISIVHNKITGFISGQAINNRYRTNYLNTRYTVAKWNALCQLQLSWKMAKTWSLEMSGNYTSAMLNEFLTIKPQGSLNLGVQKSFAENSGKVSLNLSDIFYTQITRADINYQNIDVTLLQRSDSRGIRLSFSYQLGNNKLKNLRGRNFGAEEEDKRVK
jgi:Outer membrane protein beta-barrel family